MDEKDGMSVLWELDGGEWLHAAGGTKLNAVEPPLLATEPARPILGRSLERAAVSYFDVNCAIVASFA